MVNCQSTVPTAAFRSIAHAAPNVSSLASPKPPTHQLYLMSVICTPFCRMFVNVLVMFVNIWASVPVMI